MRSVVVLPAPFGPSRPVISPSRATNPTSSTATTRALSLPLPGKVLRRCSAVIIERVLVGRSGFPAIEAGERRGVGKRGEAVGIQVLRIAGVEELRDQFRHAASTDHVVALPARDQQAGV